MNACKLNELSQNQVVTLALALHIRNALEDFHCEYVPDKLMPELNSTVRFAIYDFLENVLKSNTDLMWLLRMIPDYWEVPGTDKQPDFNSAATEH